MTDPTPQKSGPGVAAEGGSGNAAPASGEDLSAKIDELLEEIEVSRSAMEQAVADTPKDEEVAAAVAAMVGQVAEIAVAANEPGAAAPVSEGETPSPVEATAASSVADADVSQAVDELLAGAEGTADANTAAKAVVPSELIPDGVTPMQAAPPMSEPMPQAVVEPVAPAQDSVPPAGDIEVPEDKDVSRAVDELLAAAEPAAPPPASAMIPDGASPMEVVPTMNPPAGTPMTAAPPLEVAPAAGAESAAREATEASADEAATVVADADVSKAVDDLLAEVETSRVEAVAALSPGGQPGTADVAPPPQEMAVAGVALATPGAPSARDLSHLANPGNAAALAVSIASPTPPAPEPAAPKESFFVWLWGMISPGLRRALGLLSAPLAGQSRVVRDSIGWMAAWTVFLAACLWIYLGFVREAQTHQRAVGTYDFAAGELPEPPEPAEDKPAAGHSKGGEGHGEKPAEKGGHADAHGAKKAEPKKAAKKPEKKPAKKDAHAKAKEHGEPAGGGHGGGH